MGDSKNPCPPPPPRQKIPKDGCGPRGEGECYYTSRVLNSTGRYVQFIKKLRTHEEEDRIGRENQKKENLDKQILDFFTRCDRKSCINTVQNRVRLCMESYQNDLQQKRARLIQLLKEENENIMIEFVKVAQAGTEAAFQDKKDRLAYLLAKRQKEHEDKYKAIPLDKCTHIHPCVVQRRAKEAQEIQLYQMKEKQMRKMSEAEVENMWHEVAMRESDALAARMELDVIERLRRDNECHQHSVAMLEERRQARIKDRERLKQEALMMKAQMKEGDRLEEEKQRQLKEKAKALTPAGDQNAIKQKEDEIAKIKAEQKLLCGLWESLANKGLADEKAKTERRRQMERELDECNKRMADFKNQIGKDKFNSDDQILQEGQRIRDEMDYKRCLVREKDKREKKANQQYILKQIQDKKDATVTDFDRAKIKYESEVHNQISELVKYKQMTDAQAMKLYQNDLKDQIAYNNLLKERALQEEKEQRKKYEIATKQYQEQIANMLRRPYYSDGVNPFLAKMDSGLKTPDLLCTCAKNWCAIPKEVGETSKKEEEGDSAQRS